MTASQNHLFHLHAAVYNTLYMHSLLQNIFRRQIEPLWFLSIPDIPETARSISTVDGVVRDIHPPVDIVRGLADRRLPAGLGSNASASGAATGPT